MTGAHIETRLVMLCRLADLADPDSRGFTAGEGAAGLDFFVVRRGRSVRGYVNSCPHTGATLEWLPHRFLNPERTLIQCSLHMAQFRIEDGFCVWGPCAGDVLQPVEVTLHGDAVMLTDPTVLALGPVR